MQAAGAPLPELDAHRSHTDAAPVHRARDLLILQSILPPFEALIDLRTIMPLDMDTVLASIRKTNRAVVAHEAHRNAGFGAEIAARIMEQGFQHLDAPVERVGALDVPIAYSLPLESATLPSPDKIVAAVRRAMRMDA